MAHKDGKRSVVFVSLTGDEKVLCYEMDESSGSLIQTASSPAHGPSGALCLHPAKDVMYDAHVESTTLASFRLDTGTGTLSLINKADTGIGVPAHMMVSQTGQFMLTAYYGGGGVTVHRLGEDGAIGDLIQYVDTGEKAHAILSAVDDAFVLVPHVWPNNKTSQFLFDSQSGLLAPNHPPELAPSEPRTGPRHICFRPGEDVAYIVNEQGNTVTVHTFDPAQGTLYVIQDITTLPQGYKDGGATAHVEAHPNGRWLYASNRGHDSVVSFDIGADGTLSQTGHVPVPASPRSFNIDRTGQFLFCAGEAAGTMNAYRIDPADGALTQFASYDVGVKPFWVMAVDL